MVYAEASTTNQVPPGNYFPCATTRSEWPGGRRKVYESTQDTYLRAECGQRVVARLGTRDVDKQHMDTRLACFVGMSAQYVCVDISEAWCAEWR